MEAAMQREGRADARWSERGSIASLRPSGVDPCLARRRCRRGARPSSKQVVLRSHRCSASKDCVDMQYLCGLAQRTRCLKPNESLPSRTDCTVIGIPLTRSSWRPWPPRSRTTSVLPCAFAASLQRSLRSGASGLALACQPDLWSRDCPSGAVSGRQRHTDCHHAIVTPGTGAWRTLGRRLSQPTRVSEVVSGRSRQSSALMKRCLCRVMAAEPGTGVLDPDRALVVPCDVSGVDPS